MLIPYGYAQNEVGAITLNLEQAMIVSQIYDLYLQGKSLGGIVDALKERGIPSPTGKQVWARATIDKTLSNGKYVPHVIPEVQFWEAQIEKERRTNMNE